MRVGDPHGGLVELASGVDALYLSGRAAPPTELFRDLERAKQTAVELSEEVPFALGGESFLLAAHGWGKYSYCLRHPHGQVGLTASSALPALRVQPRAEFLHGAGPLPTVAWFEDVLGQAVGPLRFGTSRMDLHADWQGWTVDGDDRSRFVCRAERRDLHETDDKLLGFEFGRRTTRTLCARIYDKTAEQAQKGNDYWPQIWGDAFDPLAPVHRVEFEFGRQGLVDFDLDTPREVLEAAGALWAWATENWLSYRSPSSDSNRSRWPVAPEWADVQRASLRSDAHGVERMYQGRQRGELRKLMPVLNGCMAGMAALVGASGIDQACQALAPLLRDYEVRSRRGFIERIDKKAREYLLK
jgi:hypothetical protein